MYVFFTIARKTTDFQTVPNEMWVDPALTPQSKMKRKTVWGKKLI